MIIAPRGGATVRPGARLFVDILARGEEDITLEISGLTPAPTRRALSGPPYTSTVEIPADAADGLMIDLHVWRGALEDTVSVRVINRPPIAEFFIVPDRESYENLHLNASISRDEAYLELEYRWDYQSDGVWDTIWSRNPSVDTLLPDLSEITLEVKDSSGLTSLITKTVSFNQITVVESANMDVLNGNLSGIFLITEAITLSHPVYFQPGAQVIFANGASITSNFSFEAGASNSSSVIFAPILSNDSLNISWNGIHLQSSQAIFMQNCIFFQSLNALTVNNVFSPVFRDLFFDKTTESSIQISNSGNVLMDNVDIRRNSGESIILMSSDQGQYERINIYDSRTGFRLEQDSDISLENASIRKLSDFGIITGAQSGEIMISNSIFNHNRIAVHSFKNLIIENSIFIDQIEDGVVTHSEASLSVNQSLFSHNKKNGIRFSSSGDLDINRSNFILNGGPGFYSEFFMDLFPQNMMLSDQNFIQNSNFIFNGFDSFEIKMFRPINTTVDALMPNKNWTFVDLEDLYENINENGAIDVALVEFDAYQPASLMYITLPEHEASLRGVFTGEDQICTMLRDGFITCRYISSGDFLPNTPSGPVYGLEVDIGNDYVCALFREDRTPICWGGTANLNGELNAPPLNSLSYITSQGHTTCAIDAQARSHCWGADSESFMFSEDVQLKDLAIGDEFICGINLITDQVICEGLFDFENTPRDLFIDIDCGRSHCCGIDFNQKVICWGDQSRNQYNFEGNLMVDNLLVELESIDLGDFHGCGLDLNQKPVCWGNDESFQTSSVVNDQFKQISAGKDVTCGARVDGTGVCWGMNNQNSYVLFSSNQNYFQRSSNMIEFIPLLGQKKLFLSADNGSVTLVGFVQTTTIDREFSSINGLDVIINTSKPANFRLISNYWFNDTPHFYETYPNTSAIEMNATEWLESSGRL
ncbi:right-handed parallel beta-helix repeat-containing protein [Myxococcota bacterium]|nr:right-handed parallel beta-helix repeat-containing protein [Myxococcota bacterium]